VEAIRVRIAHMSEMLGAAGSQGPLLPVLRCGFLAPGKCRIVKRRGDGGGFRSDDDRDEYQGGTFPGNHLAWTPPHGRCAAVLPDGRVTHGLIRLLRRGACSVEFVRSC